MPALSTASTAASMARGVVRQSYGLARASSPEQAARDGPSGVQVRSTAGALPALALAARA